MPDDGIAAHVAGRNRCQIADSLGGHRLARRPSSWQRQVIFSFATIEPLMLLLLLLPLLLLLASSKVSRPSDALRMINLDAPQTVRQGDTIQLSCAYSLTTTTTTTAATSGNLRQPRAKLPVGHNGTQRQIAHDNQAPNGPNKISSLVQIAGQQQHSRARPTRGAPMELFEINGGARHYELLYAVKWYKDGREFFRYVAQDWPHKQVFASEGLNVDEEKSDNQTVVLRNVTLKTSGLFRCEVSTDAPYFLTKSIEHTMLVYFLPNEGPFIESGSDQVAVASRKRQFSSQPFHLGEQLKFRCTTGDSKPAPRIDWIINRSLNLSSFMPLNSNGAPIFQSTHKRLVQLKTTPVVVSSQQQTNAANQWRQPPISYVIYELDSSNAESTGKLLARPVEPQFSGDSVLSLPSDSLNQLPEVGVSMLNFSVDSDLLQLLARINLDSGGHHQHQSGISSGRPMGQTASSRAQKKSQPQSGHIGAAGARGTTAMGSHNDWRKSSSSSSRLIAAESRFANGNQNATTTTSRQSDTSSRLAMLQIRCVASVLHLSMSDDIKLKLVNKPKEATNGSPDGSGSSSLHRLPHQSDDNNSGLPTAKLDQDSYYVLVILLLWSLYTYRNF